MVILDPLVHGALVIVATWLVNLLLTYLKINLGGDIVTGLAQWLVGYILSLFGYSLYVRLTSRFYGFKDEPRPYHPPFS